MIEVHHGDCIEVMRSLPDNSVDSICTDPPYGLGFMGKKWDALPPGEDWARECLRVLKPGGHLLAFGGSRTFHRLAVAIEDAGFEIRDSIAWMYGSGFPKSLDVGKAIDKAAGAQREVTGQRDTFTGADKETNWKCSSPRLMDVTAPATDAAKQWEGWGTALKPAFEPIVVARKPFPGTVAANVQEWGTGALNIDATRIEGAKGWPDSKQYSRGIAWGENKDEAFTQDNSQNPSKGLGRWPANVVLDEHAATVLDAQSGVSTSTPFAAGTAKSGGIMGTTTGKRAPQGHTDSGGASRFFKVAEADEHGAISEHFPREFDAPFMYVAKAPKKERPVVDGVAHATVKPLALMRWLVKLVTPPGGTVLEPFAGSGATVEACILEGFDCIAIERETEYIPLIQARIDRQEKDAA